MEIKTLYKYERESGKTTVSPNKPDCEYTEMYRLIADEGKVLTNGTTETNCVDTETKDGWVEKDIPIEENIETENEMVS